MCINTGNNDCGMGNSPENCGNTIDLTWTDIITGALRIIRYQGIGLPPKNISTQCRELFV